MLGVRLASQPNSPVIGREDSTRKVRFRLRIRRSVGGVRKRPAPAAFFCDFVTGGRMICS